MDPYRAPFLFGGIMVWVLGLLDLTVHTECLRILIRMFGSALKAR